MKRYLAVIMLLFVGCSASPVKPRVSEADKLVIRSAQVELLQAQQAVQASAQYQAMQAAQAKLNAAVADAYTKAKVLQTEWGMNEQLEFVEQPKPVPATGAATPVPGAKK